VTSYALIGSPSAALLQIRYSVGTSSLFRLIVRRAEPASVHLERFSSLDQFAPKSRFGQMFIEESIPSTRSGFDHLPFKLHRKPVGDSPTVRRNSRLNWVND
jgi:hypothetical protein